MQDIANNNRLINTAENLPHPKRPFNKLPIVISLEILLAIYTFICFSLKPTPNGKKFVCIFYVHAILCCDNSSIDYYKHFMTMLRKVFSMPTYHSGIICCQFDFLF